MHSFSHISFTTQIMNINASTETPPPAYLCQICKEPLPNEAEYKKHKRLKHQTAVSTVIKSKLVEAKRNAAGKFDCPRCDYSHDHPQTVRKHLHTCFNRVGSNVPITDSNIDNSNLNEANQTISPAPTLQSETTPSTAATSHAPVVAPISFFETPVKAAIRALRSRGFFYHEQTRSLFCITCKSFVTQNFAGHYYDNHDRIGIPPTVIREIKESIPILTFTPSAISNHELEIDPLPALDIIKGYRCSECNALAEYKSSLSCVIAKKHNGPFVRQNLQCLYQGCIHRYFRVNSDKFADPNVLEQPPDIDVDALLAKHSVPKSLPDPTVDFRETNPFYNLTTWFTTKEEKDLYELQQVDSYFNEPPGFKKGQIRDMLIKAIKSARKVSFKNCKLLEFKNLQTEDAVRKYASFQEKIVFFIINFGRTPLSFSPIYEISCEIEGLVDRFLWDKSHANLMALLLGVLHEPTENGHYNTLLTCLRNYSVLSGFRRREVDDMQQKFSMAMNLMKVAVLATCISRDPDGEFKDSYNSIKEELPFFDQNEQFCMSELYLLKHLSKNAVPKARQLITTTEDPYIIKLDGKTVDLRFYQRTAKALRESIKEHIEFLLMGFKPKQSPTELIDNQNNPRSSFCSATPDIEKIQASLYRHILSNRNLRDEWLLKIDNSEEVFRDITLKTYLKRCDELRRDIAIYVHLTSGMPGRATEVVLYNMSSSNRSVYLRDTMLCLDALYNKNQKGERILRFVDEDISKLLIYDILFIRPFENKLRYWLDKEYSQDVLKYFLINKGNRMSSSFFIALFTEGLSNYGNVELSFNQYRHATKHVSKLLRLDRCQFLSTSAVIAQFGHGRRTSKRYAASNLDHPFLEFTDVEDFFDVSCGWWDFLDGNVTLSSGTLKRLKPNPLLQTGTELLPPNLSDFNVHVTPKYYLYPGVCDASSFRNTLVPSSFKEKDPRYFLRRLLRNEKAEFLSQEQFEAVDCSINSELNLLAILGTGGGKSATFLSNCLAHPNLYTFVLVTSVALRADIMRQAEEAGIKCSDMQSRVFEGHSLIVMTYEKFFMHLPFFMTQSPLISRVFLDEVHKIVTDRHFRTCLSKINRVQCLNAPLTLLTATAPEFVISELKCALFKYSPLKVIRSHTNRRNISYEVKEVRSESDALRIINEEIKLLKDEKGEFIDPEERIIIYCKTIDEVKFISSELPGSCIYHGSNTDEENLIAFEHWRNGHRNPMIATSAFGEGVNYGKVRLVIMFGLPYTFLDYNQFGGRAGRDGKLCKSILLFNRGVEEEFIGLLDTKKPRVDAGVDSFKVMMNFATEKSRCRRLILSEFFDQRRINCENFLYGGENAKCDNCISRVAVADVAVDEIDIHDEIDHSKEAEPEKLTEIERPKEIQPQKLTEIVKKVEKSEYRNSSCINQIDASESQGILDIIGRFLPANKKNCSFCLGKYLKAEEHSISACPELLQKRRGAYSCFGCLDIPLSIKLHGWRQCEFYKSEMTKSGFCGVCWFPVDLHKGKNASGRNCQFFSMKYFFLARYEIQEPSVVLSLLGECLTIVDGASYLMKRFAEIIVKENLILNSI
jgi:superfamily II DNA helicase RecQ